ncbi:MAG TPA: hypothetical protein VNA04_08550 [Thermoanaerobaculia bacterium]|nr:hypothetical protein [Thermoanaerobaculia bacterium]
MTDSPTPVEFTEDRVPFDGIEEAIAELVELYGGEITGSRQRERRFVLPLRRGMPVAGGVGCTLTWSPDSATEATVRLVCDREVDAPKAQRVALLVAGVIGSLLFMIWPFVAARREFGAVAWLGGAIALAVYFMTLRRSSGGIAFDFVQRLARRQREWTLSSRAG